MLGSGVRIPLVGVGTWPLRGHVCVEIVERALRLGYCHIDTAETYQNEREVGEALHASGVRRDDIFVTTKIHPSHFSPLELERATKDSLARLRLSDVDLLLLHWPNPQVPLSETLGALCTVKRAGLTRHIGVSNFTVAEIQEAVRHTSEPLICNQIEMNSFLDRPKLTAACRANGMTIVAHSPIARGKADKDAALVRIGQAHGKSAAQVSLRWLVQQGIPAIPRTSRFERLSENFSIFDFELSEAEMSEISSIAGRRSRLVNAMSPLRALALRTLPKPVKSILRTGYHMLRRALS